MAGSSNVCGVGGQGDLPREPSLCGDLRLLRKQAASDPEESRTSTGDSKGKGPEAGMPAGA